MLPNLITFKEPTKKRISKADGGIEKHLTEPAVMLAFAFHLFKSDSLLRRVEIYPDGEHGKQFDIRGWLKDQGMSLVKPEGSTSYGGEYSDGKKTIQVSLRPGFGDVVAETASYRIVAECKGGVINTRHAGQKYRLRKGLYEAVGLLMSRPLGKEKQYAVVPLTDDTVSVAERLDIRCRAAGIRICLVLCDGVILEVEG